MGVTKPPESHQQSTSSRDVASDDPHRSVTLAPPATSFDEVSRDATPTPPPSSRSDQHFRAALAAGSRTGNSLTELSKIVSELSAGLVGARQANEQLVNELSTLRAMLGSASEQQLALRQHVELLERELMDSQNAAERDRQFLTQQHDDFLVAILEEHEEALHTRDHEDDTRRMGADVSELARKLAESDSARLLAENECVRAREGLARAQLQRDEAQARAEKRERERNDLRAEASQLRARLGTHRSVSTTPPPPVTSSRPPSFRPPVLLQLDASELDSTLHTRSASPRLPSVPPRLAMPPASERAAHATQPIGLSSPSSSTPGRSAEKSTDASKRPISHSPTAEPFPRETTRPGVGGPKPSEPPPRPSFGPPPSGWTPSPPAPLPAPLPSKAERSAVASAASMPPSLPGQQPVLKKKPDPTTRPLIDYSLGADRVLSETLEGARLSSKPPRK